MSFTCSDRGNKRHNFVETSMLLFFLLRMSSVLKCEMMLLQLANYDHKHRQLTLQMGSQLPLCLTAGS